VSEGAISASVVVDVQIVLTAEELTRATATNLHGEFATVLDTAEVIARG
jgi:hypothetical protein